MNSLLREISKRQVSFTVDESGDLHVKAPQGALTIDFLDRLREIKPRLLAWLTDDQPRADPRHVTCAACRHLIPNAHSPGTGYAKCSAGLGYHWPRAKQTCDRHEGET